MRVPCIALAAIAALTLALPTGLAVLDGPGAQTVVSIVVGAILAACFVGLVASVAELRRALIGRRDRGRR